MKKASLRIGISGWTYPPWRGVFYPEKWPQKRELEYASRQVNSIEINGSFYSLQTPKSYRAWHDATPDDFIFSVKGGRYITHLKRLKDVAQPLSNFFASGLLELRRKLGPILWQFPPNFKFDAGKMERFFTMLPRTQEEASRLAKRHDSWMKGRAAVHAHHQGPLRHAVEIRHETFECPEFVDLLRAHGVALVVADTAGKWPLMEDVTADFVYVRLHGDEVLYVSGYTGKALMEWSRKICAWSTGKNPAHTHRVAPVLKDKLARDVFVYFDNDVKVHAPFDAMTLAHRLGIAPEPPPMGTVTVVESTLRPWPAVGKSTARKPRSRRPRA